MAAARVSARRLLLLRALGNEALRGEHRLATLAAFCSAVRTTVTGSMTPCESRLPYFASKIANARRQQPSLEGDVTSSELRRRVGLVRASLQKAVRAVQVDSVDTEVEASARHVVWFAADDASALTRTERSSLSIRCAFRVRVDPGPRMYGEDPEPDTALREATLEATSWPTDEQLADLVASAARSSW